MSKPFVIYLTRLRQAQPDSSIDQRYIFYYLMRKILFLLGFTLLAALPLLAQEALPQITVKNINGKVIVSWLNDFVKLPKSISIQRSFDSLKNYVTIGSVLNPENRENGYADAKPLYTNLFYRVFVAFDGGSYMFSSPARPVKMIPGFSELSTADSIALFHIRPVTYASNRVRIGRDNNVTLYLKDAETKKYSVKFYDDDRNLLFVLNKLHETDLIVDKVNFVHAGWFYFEVYESGRLLEKDRVYIPADNKTQSSNERGKKRW